jgi:predicted O-linked N-acetylglucosamine transferase (SPINDLY family)
MPTITIEQALDLAIRQFSAGHLSEAEAMCGQILGIEREHADALHLQGVIANRTGRQSLAVDLIRRAIGANPSAAEFHNTLGTLLAEGGEYEEAIAAFREALRLRPEFALACCNLGNALCGRGDLDSAVIAYRQSLQLEPEYLKAHYNLGNALRDLGKLDEASEAFRKALSLAPNDALIANNLGSVLQAQSRFGEAITIYRRAIEMGPEMAIVHNNLGAALQDHGQMDDALIHYRRAVELQPDSSVFQSNELVARHYHPETTLAGLFEAHCAYDRRHAAPLRASWRPHANSTDPERPLRLGFISPHFASHPVGRFLIRPLANLDRNGFQIVCYSDTPNPDRMTARIRSTAAEWQEVRGLSDEQLAGKIREDRVDLLFDLAGQTAGHRLGVFARKPAPIQISWLDYVGTTGLAAMDYLLADPCEIPVEAERWYRERVLRMTYDYICYDPPEEAPPVNPLPALKRGSVTFGSFNILAKTTPEIVAIWARILQRVPSARMLLMNRGLDDPPTAARYRQMFAAQGIAPERLELHGWCPQGEVLARYHRVDLALDTFPYNGGLTTCEALWMGVPVVTCPGETFASRHGLTHLTAAGCPETIARDLDHYVELAVAQATDLTRLAATRAKMRSRVATSPLCDGPGFATHLQTLLRQVWREWAAGRGTH